jgi:hypothetical protein
VKNDLLLLCETGQFEVEDVVKMYTVGVLILRNNAWTRSSGSETAPLNTEGMS